MDPDVSYLIKSDSISVGEDKTLLVMYYYHQEHVKTEKGRNHGLRDRTFYRCVCRLDSNTKWNEMAEGLLKEAPAERFLLTSIGLNDRMGIRSDRFWTNSNASRWLKLKIRKRHSLEEFITGRKTKTGLKPGRKLPGAFETDLPYLKEYDHGGLKYSLETPYDFPEGTWLVSTRIAPPRKKPKIIKD